MTGSRIYLVGMPGSGKTTVGKKLGMLSGQAVFDLDDLVEARAGQRVPVIFETRGEAAFRQIETETLREVTASHSSFILSCGGGTPCFLDNMTFIKAHGSSVFLDVPVKELSVRLKKAEGVRPLVEAHRDDLEQYLVDVLKERLPYYEQATHRLGPGQSITDLAKALGFPPVA